MFNEEQFWTIFEQFGRKVRLLKAQHDAAQDRIRSLEEENRKLTKQLKQEQEKNGDLRRESRLKTENSQFFTKIVKNNLSGTDTNNALKEQLDGYIREIERCITHLSRLS